MTDRTRDRLAQGLLARKGTAAPLMLVPGEGRRGLRATTVVVWVSAIGVAVLAATPYFHSGAGILAPAPVTVGPRGPDLHSPHYADGSGASPAAPVSRGDSEITDMDALRSRSPNSRSAPVQATNAPPAALRAVPSDAPLKKVARARKDGARKPAAAPFNRRSHRVQLIALRSPVAVQRRWRSLRRRHVDLFGDLRMTTIKATARRSGAEIYRLQVGPFRTRLAARQLCRKARKRRLDCLVVGP